MPGTDSISYKEVIRNVSNIYIYIYTHTHLPAYEFLCCIQISLMLSYLALTFNMKSEMCISKNVSYLGEI